MSSKIFRIIVALMSGCVSAAIPYVVENMANSWVRTAGIYLSTPGIFVGIASTIFTGGNAHTMSRWTINVGNCLFYSMVAFGALTLIPRIVKRKTS